MLPVPGASTGTGEVAHSHFKQSGKPRIFIYFKNADVKTTKARKEDLNSLWDFRDKLNALGHFPGEYDNVEALILNFTRQLEKLLLS